MSKMTRREFLLFSMSVLGASAFKFDLKAGSNPESLSIHVLTADPEGTYKMLVSRIAKEINFYTVFADSTTKEILKYRKTGFGRRAVVFARKLPKDEITNITVVKNGKIYDPRSSDFSEIYAKLLKEEKGSYLISIAIEDSRTSLSKRAVVEIEGKRVDEIELFGSKVRTINTPGGEMVLEVKNGKIAVKESACRHKICVRTGFISQSHEKIICIPNRTVISIEGNPLVDAITS